MEVSQEQSFGEISTQRCSKVLANGCHCLKDHVKVGSGITVVSPWIPILPQGAPGANQLMFSDSFLSPSRYHFLILCAPTHSDFSCLLYPCLTCEFFVPVPCYFACQESRECFSWRFPVLLSLPASPGVNLTIFKLHAVKVEKVLNVDAAAASARSRDTSGATNQKVQTFSGVVHTCSQCHGLL